MPQQKILFIASHRPDRSPNQRYRFEQYFRHLEANGFQCELSYFIDEEADRYFYQPGHLFKKIKLQLRSLRVRFGDLRKARNADIIFICREALMLRFTWFEKWFSRSGAKVIYDFDDAIWRLDVSEANKNFGWLKRPGKTADIIAHSHMVFAGNAYLADYARQFNTNVVVIPTTIDTDLYTTKPADHTNKLVVIGWTGSLTTIKHFEYAVPILLALKARYGQRIAFSVVGDPSYINEELGIRGIAWSAADELAQLHRMDIGIMPLPDDEWTKGKCGLKGLQYMAAGLPAVMSAVGVNTEIIQDGQNGHLAATPDEWIAKLSALIESPELRQRLGTAARTTVEERYSVNALRESYLQQFHQIVENH